MSHSGLQLLFSAERLTIKYSGAAILRKEQFRSTYREGGCLMSPDSPPRVQPVKEDKSLTVRRLFAEIQLAAQAKEFKRADELRDKLIETDPMALSEIIKSSEIIEGAKTAGINRDHLAIWARLYDELSEEERNGLYYSMKQYTVPPKKLLLKQGALNYRLFFIDQGKVTIFYPKDGKNILLAQLGRGELLGEYAFATISLCSASAITHTEVQLMCLESSAADGWEEKFPGLYDKLIDFCMKNGRIDEIMTNKRMEKRHYDRYPAKGRVSAVLLTEDGKRSETIFHGDLTDVSMSGACFMIHCPKKSIVKGLLAKHLHVSISWIRKDGPVTITTIGKVVRVSFHLYDDYSLHVGFNQLQPEKLFQGLQP
jgi:hypothetical protein